MSHLPATGGRVLRVAAAVAVVGALLTSGAFFLGLQSYYARRDLATAFVTGKVVQTGIGDNGDIRVGWKDALEQPHVRVFSAYEDYAVGDAFGLRYDPRHPSGAVYPTDDPETDEEDGYMAGVVLSALIGGLLLLSWGLRWWWWRRGLSRPAVTCAGVALSGSFNLADSSWLQLGESRWQMVMWDPALDDLPAGTPVEVRGDLSRRRRVVPVLPGQVPLVPLGRLRHKVPTTYELRPRHGRVVDLDDVLVLPHGVRPPMPRPWWSAMAWRGMLGAVLGAAGSAVVGVGWLSVAFALGLATLLSQSWALSGGEP